MGFVWINGSAELTMWLIDELSVVECIVFAQSLGRFFNYQKSHPRTPKSAWMKTDWPLIRFHLVSLGPFSFRPHWMSAVWFGLSDLAYKKFEIFCTVYRQLVANVHGGWEFGVLLDKYVLDIAGMTKRQPQITRWQEGQFFIWCWLYEVDIESVIRTFIIKSYFN